MAKIINDKYYTPDSIAKCCVEVMNSVCDLREFDYIIEPSAGDGVFLNHLPITTIAMDIEPEDDRVAQCDFLTYQRTGRKVLTIGNPPFGDRGNLFKSFINHAFKFSEYVAFILPINQFNNKASIYKYDLVKSIDLGVSEYSGVKIHCCFNVYKKPLNPKERNKYLEEKKVVSIKEIIKSSDPKRNKDVGSFAYDFAICGWGASLGKVSDVGQYAKMFAIKTDSRYISEKLKTANWKEMYKMVGTPNLLQWQIFEYINKLMKEAK